MSDSDNPACSLDIWWPVPDVLAGMSMPFIHPERYDTPGAKLDAFPDELPDLWRVGIRAIVCLLNMPGAAATYSAAGFAFLLLPIDDGAAPTMAQFNEFFAFVSEQRNLGHPVAVHCEAGLGRTGTMVSAFLVASGFKADDAITQIRSVRSGAIETARQLQFVRELSAN